MVEPALVLVVADDFGSWPEKTDAIVAALESGFVTAASIMPNFPDFERACALAESKGLRDRVGAHLTLTEGTPLTEAMRSSQSFSDSEGNFADRQHAAPIFHLSSHEQRLVAAELRAQTHRMRLNGFELCHLDSHQHVHVQPAMLGIFIALAHELGVPRLRLAPNLMPEQTRRYRAYSWLANRRIRWQGLAGTHFVANLPDYLALPSERRPTERLELYVHPKLVDGRIEDQDIPGAALEPLLSPLLAG
jgi:predicted glycoside hydrolase/deacetylase ChbG (UPF0249 family)